MKSSLPFNQSKKHLYFTAMKNFVLTPEKIEELRRAHRAAKRMGDVRLAYRLNAVILLGTGWTLRQVSEALLLDEETLRNYISRYTILGIEKEQDTE